VLYLTDKYDYIKNKIGLLHVLFGEWKWIVVDWKVVRWKLEWWLHSARVVEDLLKKWEIKVKCLVKEWIDENWQLRREFTDALDYEEWKKLDDVSRLNVKICDRNGRNCSRLKTLFLEDWTEKMIAEAFAKAEREIIDWFGGKMVKELDEEIFKKYCKEWWVDLNSRYFQEILLPSFRNGTLNLEFWEFGSKFTRNVIEYNGLKIRVWGRYVYKDGRYILSDEVNTLYPKKE